MGNVSQRTSTGEPRQTGTFWDAVEENVEDQDPEYEYEDDEQEETIAAPTRRRPRRNILDDEDEESEEEEEPFNTPESSAEHALFITQQDPEPYHEPGTMSWSQKGKTPAARKRPSSSTNIWASFSLTTDTSTSAANPAPMAKKKPWRVVAEEQNQPPEEPHVAEEEARGGNVDRPQAATSTLSSSHWTVNCTMRKSFLKPVVLQETLIDTRWFMNGN